MSLISSLYRGQRKRLGHNKSNIEEYNKITKIKIS